MMGAISGNTGILALRFRLLVRITIWLPRLVGFM